VPEGVLTDLSRAALARAIEENGAEFLLALGRVGGGEESRDPRLTYTVGGSPIGYHNAVVRADLPHEEADRAIAATRELMRARGVPGCWHVGPSMRPRDLVGRLAAHGFVGEPEPGMAARLPALHEAWPIPEGLAVGRVGDEAGLVVFADVLAQGFGEGEKEARWVEEMYRRIGLGDDVPWRHYLGRLAGVPVATVSLFFAAGVAGVYFVSTAPEYRRRGIGAAVTLSALRAARELGFRAAVLGSSPLGHGVYRRLGFEELCRIQVCEWSPTPSDATSRPSA
jgi:ribosomal protein S18 acetylase RimI-like enzyme